ncbi:/ / dUTP diphosphatase / 120248:120742 Reverse [Candidatus Hepatoplasma crinochetorum]|uniref:/ / dUTP diphosphatase / 120248:120742 Reverse n=1 Tax=Candidatus Hepatoplasma crinochetorum TaxID=295596 RepID=A0A0G7ZNE9_9MOLU|nr:/ / dUTP diphosphatase / 120248:120742 Reverse [Candidatus Hepatoplasma crinochetorum]
MILKINFKNISDQQKILDQYILKKSNFKNNQEIFNKKIIAIFVELGEFANELRFFKYWSKKEHSKKEVILDEFVDIIHFLISIANDLKYDDWDIEIKEENKEIEILYLEIINLILVLQKKQEKKALKEIFVKLLQIGIYYDFEVGEIFNSYKLKNQINFTRQDTNY